jgi:hypothetical protein
LMMIDVKTNSPCVCAVKCPCTVYRAHHRKTPPPDVAKGAKVPRLRRTLEPAAGVAAMERSGAPPSPRGDVPASSVRCGPPAPLSPLPCAGSRATRKPKALRAGAHSHDAPGGVRSRRSKSSHAVDSSLEGTKQPLTPAKPVST